MFFGLPDDSSLGKRGLVQIPRTARGCPAPWRSLVLELAAATSRSACSGADFLAVVLDNLPVPGVVSESGVHQPELILKPDRV
jgi:hypothetical protein